MLDGKTSAAMMIYQLPGANAIEVANGIESKLKELSGSFPPGMDYIISFDATQGHQGINQGSDHHAVYHRDSRGAYGLYFPAELSGNTCTCDHHSSFTHRHVCRDGGDGVFR